MRIGKMSKRFLMFLMVVICISFIPGCSEDKNTTESSSKEERKMNLISIDRMFEMTGLDKNNYPGVDFTQFIAEFEITEDDVMELNIDRLLRGYPKMKNSVSYEYLFDGSRNTRNADFYDGIVYIAAYYNIESSIKSVLYDVKGNKKYYSNQGYVFSSVSPEQGTDCEQGEIDGVLDVMKTIGVFEWKSVTDEEQVKYAGQSFVIAVEYEDGSVFTVKFEGVVAKTAPENYKQFVDKVFN